MQNPPLTIPVELGAPTYKIDLLYAVLYDAKPFEDAVLLLYDNGVYKILSPGENHYGVYVIKGSIEGSRWEMTFISIPHEDWYDNVALHTLSFEKAALTFGQQAYLPSDPNIPKQHGTFQIHANTIVDPRETTWDDLPHPR
ncbi:hypothetical protein [Pseudomonas sp. MPB26]|uniref:hypothetical protein n=1 Tax=Pseudomonas sp. MPB26 TaxID=3388491 RepID=UPI003984ED25